MNDVAQKETRELTEANRVAADKVRDQTQKILVDQAQSAADAERYKNQKAKYEADLSQNRADVAAGAAVRAAYEREMVAYRKSLSKSDGRRIEAATPADSLTSPRTRDVALVEPGKSDAVRKRRQDHISRPRCAVPMLNGRRLKVIARVRRSNFRKDERRRVG